MEKKKKDNTAVSLNIDLQNGVKRIADILQKMDKEGADEYKEINEKEIAPGMKASYGIHVKFLDKKKDKKEDI